MISRSIIHACGVIRFRINHNGSRARKMPPTTISDLKNDWKDKLTKAGLRRNWVWILVLVTVIFQFITIFNSELIFRAKLIWYLRGASAEERSGFIAFGRGFSEYIQFLNEIIPDDAMVVIPKESQGGVFGHVGMMQYYLFPRTIVDCPPDIAEQCVLSMRGGNTYILAPNSVFPPRSAANQIKEFILFEGDQGVYVPIPES